MRKTHAHYIEQLKLFIAEHGHSQVPTRWSVEPGLYGWLASIRYQCRQGTLNEAKGQQLREMGVDLPSPEITPTIDETSKRSSGNAWENFERMIVALRTYRKANPLGLPTSTDTAHKDLAKFIKYMRQRSRMGTLPESWRAALQNLGVTFGPDPNSPLQEAETRIGVLERYRTERGNDHPSRGDSNPEYASLAAWIHRLRRYHRGGGVPSEVVTRLREAGIDLGTEFGQRKAGDTLEDKAFETNLAILDENLNSLQMRQGVRDLRYKDIKNNQDYAKSYRFIEHMVTKARHGILPESHRLRLQDLEFTVNGKPVSEVLNPEPSLRSVEGAAISQARYQVKQATSEVARTSRIARQLRGEVEARQNSIARTQAMEQLLCEHIADIRLRAEELEQTTLSRLEDVCNIVSRELGRLGEMIRMANGGSNACTYLTVAQFAERIHYDVRTVRERLLPKLKEGLHYIRPFGRRILVVWEAVQRDMHNGELSSLFGVHDDEVDDEEQHGTFSYR